MSITENFLVNTKNFDAIIEELRSIVDLPEKITNKFLEQQGYSNPSDLLVLHLFKDLSMLNDDGSPTELFEKFQNKKTSKQAMAQGIVEAYVDLFKSNSLVYRAGRSELKEEFKKFFGSSKSDLILKYMANTFLTLVEYAGQKNVEAVAEKYLESVSGIEEVIREVAEKQKNGTSKPAAGSSEDEIAVAESDEETDKHLNPEEKGEIEIDQLIDLDKPTPISDEVEKEGRIETSVSHSFEVVEHVELSKSENSSDEVTAKQSSENSKEQEIEIKDEKEEPADQINEASEGQDNESEETESEMSKQENNKQKSSIPEDTNDEVLPMADEKHEKEMVEDSDPFGFEAIMDFDKDREKEESKDEKQPEATGSESEPAPSPEDAYVNKAFLKKAELLFKLKKFEEALPALEAVIDKYESSKESDYVDHVAKSVLRRAFVLEKLDRPKEALKAYEDVYSRFEKSERVEYYNQASNALIKRIEIMKQLDLDEEIGSLYPKVIERFGDSDNPRYTEYVDKAYVFEVEKLTESDDPEKALKALDSVIQRFIKSEKINEFLEKSMYMKAELLEQLGKNEEALEAYDAILETFGNES